MKWLVLASLIMGPWPDQVLVYAFKDGQYLQDQAGAMDPDECFQQAADITQYLYTQYGPRQNAELAVVFCITPY